MNARLTTLAVALAAAAATTAIAQATAPNPSAPPPLFDQVTAAEYGTPPAPAVGGEPNVVSEPTASLSRNDGPGADFGKQLVDQINGDERLKGSKITVVPEEGAVTLVGTTQTRAQAQQVAQMAAEKVGAEKVVNAIRPSEIYIEVAPPQEPVPADEAGAQADSGEAQAAQDQPNAGQASANGQPAADASSTAQPQPAR